MRRLKHFTFAVLGLLFRHPVLGTGVIPILPDGRIVLARRRDTGRWGLPGGMMKWGEDITTTVRRELFEETGLEMVAVRRLVGVYSAPGRDPRLHSICVVVAASVQGRMQIQDTLEMSEVRAFRPQDIPMRELSHDHAQHLRNYFQGVATVA